MPPRPRSRSTRPARAARPAARRRLTRFTGALAVGAAALAAPTVARLTPLDLFAALRDAPATVAELPAETARDLAAVGATVTGRHLGFDTYRYPGARAMRAWRAAAPYEWVGYYLASPCHPDDSWMGKRAEIEGLGYGTAVIYVGQQTWDGHPKPSAAALRAAEANGGPSCLPKLLGAERGREEARDAMAATAGEGFPTGTVIFLDIEYMDRTPPAMRDYYRAWVREVLADGRFRPGVYVHTRNARLIHRDFTAEYAAAGIAEAPPVWVASGRGFSPDKRPADVGHAFAGIWQGVLDTWETHDGVRLPIDVNVAAVPSPSAREFAAYW